MPVLTQSYVLKQVWCVLWTPLIGSGPLYRLQIPSRCRERGLSLVRVGARGSGTLRLLHRL